MTTIQDRIWIPVSAIEDIPIVINNALLVGGWKPGPNNPGQHLLTATDDRKHTEENFVWDMKFQMVLRWAPERRKEFAKALITDKVGTARNPFPNRSCEMQLAKFEDDSYGNTVFIDLSETARQDSSHAIRQRIDLFKEVLVQEALVFLATGHPKPNPKIYPSASFADEEKLAAKGYLADFDDHRRFIVSHIGNRWITIPPREANRHTLVCGPTGTGKSRSIFAPNIIERTNVSMIITEATAGDEAPHLFSATSGWRAANGHTILYFNPDDLASDQLNPLDMIHTDRDARMVCELIMRTTTQKSHKGDQFWDTSERMLLTALLLHVCGHRKQGYAHMGHVVELVNRSEEELRKIAMHSPVQQAYDRFQAFFSRGTDNTRNIVMSCVGQRLDLWNDARTQALTNKTSVDLASLKDSLFTFYLVLSAEKEDFKPLAVLLWHYMLHIISNNRFKHPLALVLDEFANLGYVRGMKEKLTLYRHLDIGISFGVQDVSLVEQVYEKESDIFFSQPATKIYFTPNQLKDAKAISESLGNTTLIDPELQGSSVRYQKIQRPLLTPDEIMNPTINDQLIVFLPSSRPAHISHISWMAYDDYERKYPPLPRNKIEIDEGLKFRYPEDQEEQPPVAPWDPVDKDMADQEKQKRSKEQVVVDSGQERKFQLDEKNRVASEVTDTQREIEQLKYYNTMKAHLAREIKGADMAQSLLKKFEEEHLTLLAKNKGKALSPDEKETEEVAALKIRIMRDVIQDIANKKVQPDVDSDYPLPWNK